MSYNFLAITGLILISLYFQFRDNSKFCVLFKYILVWAGMLILAYELPVLFGVFYVDGELFVSGEYINKEFISSPAVQEMLNTLRFEKSLAFSLPFWVLFLGIDCLFWYPKKEYRYGKQKGNERLTL